MIRMERELKHTVIKKFDAAVVSNSPRARVCVWKVQLLHILSSQAAAGIVPGHGAMGPGGSGRQAGPRTAPENGDALLAEIADAQALVVRYCKLFSVMDQEREGIERYTHYIRQRIAAHMQRELDTCARVGRGGGGLGPCWYCCIVPRRALWAAVYPKLGSRI